MHYHGRGGGAVDGADGDCGKSGAGGKADQRHQALFAFPVSTDSPGASGAGVHSREYHCQCAGVRLGLYAGGLKGHGGAGEAGGGAGESGVSGIRV